jgi:tRNA nucleotidyltransferase/poly(A) polymerase|uniref:Nucleotidyltransferase n=1 Tax=Siphoviridae sp. ctHip2 TaxID=2827830 RepID=A0A8S5RVH6_9CAUD|nr:MAG TPA: Nucleotidyltransferase [Siphoviridae sp. ctHip2]
MTKLKTLLKKLSEKGAKTYYVGGCVRDEVLGKTNKDIDIEIHFITEDDFISVAKSLGIKIDFVGKSFGVYKAFMDGTDFDFSFPRTEKQIGEKHTDFEIVVDPFIGEAKAAERRDFTINALMKDTQTGKILDFFGGMKDLETGVIRHCTEKFAEDSLRVFRAAQFASRFGFEIAPETIEISKTLDCSILPMERIFEETHKAITKSEKPSVFFKKLEKMGVLTDFFPTSLKLELIDKLTQATKELCPEKVTEIVIAFIFESSELTITNQTEIVEMIKSFKFLAEVTSSFIKDSKTVGEFVFKTEQIKFKEFALFSILVQGIKLGLPTFEIKLLTSMFKVSQEIISTQFITGQELIQLGFKPSKEFGELILQSKKLACQGKSKKEFIESLTK